MILFTKKLPFAILDEYSPQKNTSFMYYFYLLFYGLSMVNITQVHMSKYVKNDIKKASRNYSLLTSVRDLKHNLYLTVADSVVKLSVNLYNNRKNWSS